MSNIAVENPAFVILVNDDNTMTITQRRRIVQRSKLVDDLWFLVAPTYNDHAMDSFTVLLEYVLPVSKRYRTEILTLSGSYNEYLKYLLPIDTDLTSEAGDIDLMISFIKADIDMSGKSVQRARKVTGAKVHITSIAAWSDIIPDSALSALDQRIIKTDAQIRALAELENILAITKADDLVYDKENNELQLSANGVNIGSKVKLNCTEASLEDGVPVVNFSNPSSGGEAVIPDVEDNVIEF